MKFNVILTTYEILLKDKVNGLLACIVDVYKLVRTLSIAVKIIFNFRILEIERRFYNTIDFISYRYSSVRSAGLCLESTRHTDLKTTTLSCTNL